MTITSNNFDIYSIINKASAEDKATIFCDELLRMALENKHKFNDQERETLAASFITNEEKHLLNFMIQRCTYSIMSISQAEKSLADARYFEMMARLCFSAMEDKFLIDELITNVSKEAAKSKFISDKKEVKKILNNLKDQIQEITLLGFCDKGLIKKLVDRFYNQNDQEKDADFYEEKFVQFFKDQVNSKANTASEFLRMFQESYKDFDAKFEVVDNKIKGFGSRD